MVFSFRFGKSAEFNISVRLINIRVQDGNKVHLDFVKNVCP